MINPYRVVELASPVSGVIDVLHVERSQKVTAGQVVAQLQANVERSNVELARYRANIQSEIKLEQVNVNYDSLRKKRIDSLRQQQVVSVENTDEAIREENLSRWKLVQARELAAIRKLELQRAEEQLQQKSIRVPFDGYILDTFKDSGEYVEDQPILRLAQLDPLLVEAIVPMEHFYEVMVGTPAEVLPEVLSGVKLKAKVIVVDRIGDTASNTFGVRLVLANPENRIPAGLKCVLKFLKPVKEPVDSSIQATDDPNRFLKKAASIQKDVDNPVLDQQIAATNNIEQSTKTALPSTENKPADSSNTFVVANDTKRETASGYFVVTPQKETVQHTRALINRLQQAGISDLLKMDHGPYKGQIMLGYYEKLNPAEIRRKSLQKLGFTVEILQRE